MYITTFPILEQNKIRRTIETVEKILRQTRKEKINDQNKVVLFVSSNRPFP